MLINLKKSFQFSRGDNEYSVDYTFTNNRLYSNADNKLSLELDISINGGNKTSLNIAKPSTTLYQANEIIEKMIQEEVVGAQAETKETAAG